MRMGFFGGALFLGFGVAFRRGVEMVDEAGVEMDESGREGGLRVSPMVQNGFLRL